jgi:hypothetical protein
MNESINSNGSNEFNNMKESNSKLSKSNYLGRSISIKEDQSKD